MSITSHNWNLSIPEAIALQKQLREQIQLTPLAQKIRYVAGTDISFNKFSDTVYAGIVVLELATLREVSRALIVTETNFPYVPGLLSFREIPAILQAWEQLVIKPDLIIADGHGIAHPRRLGIATHLGLTLDIPTIGCGKSRLTGTFTEPDNEAGASTPLWDHSEQIGIVLRSKRNTRPLFVSPGHKITFTESVDLIKKCITKYRLPETTRRVHEAVNEFRIAYKNQS